MIHPIELATKYGDHHDRLRTAYAAAIGDAGFDDLVIHSGVATKQSRFDDQYWPHKPTPAFAHWLPLAEPDAAVVVRPGDRPRLIRTRVEDFWEGAPEPPGDHFWASFEIIEVSDARHIADHLPTGRVAFVGEHAHTAESWGLSAKAVNPPALVAALDQIRTIKSAYEVACIGEANRIAMRGHEAVVEAFRARPVSELELHLLYLRVTEQDDADTPYKNIVAIGNHAATLHHVRYGRSASDSIVESLLVDAGAGYMGYASDITRTTLRAPREELPLEQALLFESYVDVLGEVKSIQKSVIREIEPGKPFETLHDRAHEMLAFVLNDFGIAEASRDELIETGITRAFFPHGLGHSLGIQVHDVGCRLTEPRPENGFLRNTSTIAAGHVFTIEPGVYIIDELLDPFRDTPAGKCINWTAVERMRRFGGVRIEDNIAVLADRVQNLTRPDDNGVARP